MKTQSVTQERLTPILHQIFQQVTAQLPADIASRLKPARCVTRHGTRNSVLISAIRDRHVKSGVIHPHYLKYEHVYDPDRAYNPRTDWHVQFYLNPNRVYQHPKEVIARLEPALQSLRLPGFEWYRRPNWIGVIHRFDFGQPLDQLPSYLVPRYVALIQAVHPILIPVIDAFTQSSPDERAEVITGRRALRTRNATVTDDSSELNRGVSPALRQRVLASYQHLCARCKSTSQQVGATLQIDHAKPVCFGGVTREENLQPLCPECHQWKGVRTVRFPPPKGTTAKRGSNR